MKTMHRLLAATLMISLASACSAEPRPEVTSNVNYTVDTVADGLGIPWGLTQIDDKTILATDRVGKLNRIDLDTGAVSEIGGVPDVWAIGQGGFLDIVQAPDFKDSGWLYFTYSKSIDGQAATVLARARYQPGTNPSTLTDWSDLLETESRTDTSRHFGSRLLFIDDKLFMSVGERGVRPNGQDLSQHAGSLLRLEMDGSPAQGNPFASTQGALPEIWSYGHRNPQGLAYDPERKQLWEIEHGPRGGDEINLISAGHNYGWPVISYGKEYTSPAAVGESTEKEGMDQPEWYYIPSIAPSSLLYYDGDAFPGWDNSLFAGALAMTHLNRLQLDDSGKIIGEEQLLKDRGERIRSLLESPEGWLYLGTDSGQLLRLRPADE